MKQMTFKLLYEKYYQSVYKSTLAIVRDESLAKDVTQETFITVYNELSQSKDITNIKNWIITIATRKAIDMIRKESKILSIDKIDIMFADSKTPFDIVNNKEEQLLLNHALQELDFKYRQVIILKYYYDLSYEEIGSILKISKGTVKSRLHRAKKSLKDKLKPSYDIEVML